MVLRYINCRGSFPSPVHQPPSISVLSVIRRWRLSIHSSKSSPSTIPRIISSTSTITRTLSSLSTSPNTPSMSSRKRTAVPMSHWTLRLLVRSPFWRHSKLQTTLKAFMTLLLTFSTSATGEPHWQCEVQKRLQAVDSSDHNVGTYSCINPRAHRTSGIHNPSLAHQ
jgi:hypothetical protein